MNARYDYPRYVASTLLAVGLVFALSQTLLAQPAATAAEEGVEVLTRGPVHEAFAETVTYDPEPGIITPKTPPAAIEELPPEQRPEGTNVAWIPGYWAWDDERDDFLWVSGVWRALPPGRQWVPGYWGKSEQGFQWTSGYWADAQEGEVEYLPEPPATVEVGPSIAAPSQDDTWLPGCWVWQVNRYVWRPGFWAAVQPNWIWIPAHYVWAPRGYVFVDGYWDYSIARRGVLFAPVYFNASVYGRQGFSYSPRTVIDLGVFGNHLFLRPQYQHYYFGDYYAANYRGAGFYPWFSINTRHFGYDPFYAHERWQHREDSGWERRMETNFDNLRDHDNLRPPRTWAGQGLLNASEATSQVGLPRVAALLDDLRRDRESTMRFQPVDPTERKQFNQHAQDVQKFREERQKLDTSAAGVSAEPRNKEFVPAKVKRPGSPIVAKPNAEIGKEHAPPKTYEAPKFDTKVEPKPRVIRSTDKPQQHTVNRQPLDQPQPKAERQIQQPQLQPKVERQIQQPQPKAERQVQKPQPQPKAERQLQQPQPQPKVERQVQQPQPKAERQAPQPQPKAERQAPQPRGKDSGEQKQEQHQEKHQDKEKN